MVQSLATSAASVHDLSPSEDLLQGEEGCVWGDGGCRGIGKRPAHQDRKVAWHVAMGPGQGRKVAREQLGKLLAWCKARVRAKVEHLFSMGSRCLATVKEAGDALGEGAWAGSAAWLRQSAAGRIL